MPQIPVRADPRVPLRLIRRRRRLDPRALVLQPLDPVTRRALQQRHLGPRIRARSRRDHLRLHLREHARPQRGARLRESVQSFGGLHRRLRPPHRRMRLRRQPRAHIPKRTIHLPRARLRHPRHRQHPARRSQALQLHELVHQPHRVRALQHRRIESRQHTPQRLNRLRQHLEHDPTPIHEQNSRKGEER